MHLKYDKMRNKFDILYKLRDTLNCNPIRYHRIIKIKDIVLMFGGYDDTLKKDIDDIYEYDVTTNAWSKLHIKLPVKMDGFGCTAIIHNQCVLLCGGGNIYGTSTSFYNDIWIYSVCNKSFTKSQMKCPMKGRFQAFTINDKRKNELAVFGFYVMNGRIQKLMIIYFHQDI